MKEIEKRLENKSVRPTAMRILIYKYMVHAYRSIEKKIRYSFLNIIG